MFDEFLLPTTEREILKEVSEELKIPLSKVEETFNIWLKYIKTISKETDQAMIDFPSLGKMYFSREKCKYTTSTSDKEYRDMKNVGIDKLFEGITYRNNHDDLPIVHRWGLSKPNYSKYGNPKFTTIDLVEKQNKKFYENNRFIK